MRALRAQRNGTFDPDIRVQPGPELQWEESEVATSMPSSALAESAARPEQQECTAQKTGIASPGDFWLAAARSLSPPKSACQSLQVIHREASRRCGPLFACSRWFSCPINASFDPRLVVKTEVRCCGCRRPTWSRNDAEYKRLASLSSASGPSFVSSDHAPGGTRSHCL